MYESTAGSRRGSPDANGRLIVVSGGSSGIGRAIAARLSSQGDTITIIGRRTARLAAVTAELERKLGRRRVRAIAANLSDPVEVQEAADKITAHGREVDVLVNNAGGNLAPFPSEDLEGMRRDWLANITGNVLPAALLTQALVPAIRQPNGRIITIGSVAAVRGPATYGGAKAALHPWSAELAAQLASRGVTVNVIAPGYITGTEFYGKRMSAEFHAGRAQQSPMNRGGTVEEVAAAVEYLAGPDAGFITGQVIHINGGALLDRA
jgi:3-oxoacyl-[acyl-carrier protein] reductase